MVGCHQGLLHTSRSRLSGRPGLSRVSKDPSNNKRVKFQQLVQTVEPGFPRANGWLQWPSIEQLLKAHFSTSIANNADVPKHSSVTTKRTGIFPRSQLKYHKYVFLSPLPTEWRGLTKRQNERVDIHRPVPACRATPRGQTQLFIRETACQMGRMCFVWEADRIRLYTAKRSRYHTQNLTVDSLQRRTFRDIETPVSQFKCRFIPQDIRYLLWFLKMLIATTKHEKL